MDQNNQEGYHPTMQDYLQFFSTPTNGEEVQHIDQEDTDMRTKDIPLPEKAVEPVQKAESEHDKSRRDAKKRAKHIDIGELTVSKEKKIPSSIKESPKKRTKEKKNNNGAVKRKINFAQKMITAKPTKPKIEREGKTYFPIYALKKKEVKISPRSNLGFSLCNHCVIRTQAKCSFSGIDGTIYLTLVMCPLCVKINCNNNSLHLI